MTEINCSEERKTNRRMKKIKNDNINIILLHD